MHIASNSLTKFSCFNAKNDLEIKIIKQWLKCLHVNVSDI